MDDIYDFITRFNLRIDEVDDVLSNNRIWRQRTVDVGIVSAEDAQTYGFRSVNVIMEVERTILVCVHDMLGRHSVCDIFSVEQTILYM